MHRTVLSPVTAAPHSLSWPNLTGQWQQQCGRTACAVSSQPEKGKKKTFEVISAFIIWVDISLYEEVFVLRLWVIRRSLEFAWLPTVMRTREEYFLSCAGSERPLESLLGRKEAEGMIDFLWLLSSWYSLVVYSNPFLKWQFPKPVSASHFVSPGLMRRRPQCGWRVQLMSHFWQPWQVVRHFRPPPDGLRHSQVHGDVPQTRVVRALSKKTSICWSMPRKVAAPRGVIQ